MNAEPGAEEKGDRATPAPPRRKGIPKGLWTKCDACSTIIYEKVLAENLKVCPRCNYHFSLGAYERIKLLVDESSFQEMDADLRTADPLKFMGPKSYRAKLDEDRKVTGLAEAVVTGTGKIGGRDIVIAVTDSRFIMGSMGSVVGEKITRAVEHATQERHAMIIVSGSGGGARMYEGMLSLMQMAKTSAAVARHLAAELLYISILTNPTMAGVMASFASLGDLVIAEPKALIGFTGPRVIEQTIHQKLPEGFQTSEFLLEHGWLDKVLERKALRPFLEHFLKVFRDGGGARLKRRAG